jgi:2-C-methyl-D-erythritol 4-phosphate cytidylyltransferase
MTGTKKDSESGSPVGVILAAAGRGVRCGKNPKQFLDLGGRAMLLHSVEALLARHDVNDAVLVLPEDRLDSIRSLVGEYPKLKLVKGGILRWESVRNGFHALHPADSIILIHDVARPFLPDSVVNDCIGLAREGRANVAAIPAVDTIKQVKNTEVEKTLDRRRLIQVQTPQVFPRHILEVTYDKFIKAQGQAGAASTTDEAGMAEWAGFPVFWTMGSAFLAKITTPEDLKWAQWIVDRSEKGELSFHD